MSLRHRLAACWRSADACAAWQARSGFGSLIALLLAQAQLTVEIFTVLFHIDIIHFLRGHPGAQAHADKEMQDILNNRPDFTLKGENPTAQAVIDTSSFATGIATTIIAPERLLALKNISVTRPLTNAEKLELKAAGIDAGFYKEGWSSTPVGLQTTNGIIISNPNKTTTVLGTYVSDTDSILNQQLNAVKNNNFTNDAPGGFNLLNTDNELYQLLGAEKYWEKVNRPFLDAAILRGDDIAIATPPTSTNLFRNGELSGFGKEIKYLEEKGFHYDPITKKMVKGK